MNRNKFLESTVALLGMCTYAHSQVATLDFTSAAAAGSFPGNNQASFTYDDYDLGGGLTIDILVEVVGGATLDQREQGWGSNGANSGRLDDGESMSFTFSDLQGTGASSITALEFIGFVAEVADSAFTITSSDVIIVNGVTLNGRDEDDSTGLVTSLTWAGAGSTAATGYDLEDDFTGDTSALSILPTGTFTVAAAENATAAPNFDSMRVAGFQINTLTNDPDSDADNLADLWELATAGNLTDLTGLLSGPGPGAGTGDFDGDTLSDLQEYQLAVTNAMNGISPSFPNLDPTSIDTDGDLINDNVELDDGTDPTDSTDPAPPGEPLAAGTLIGIDFGNGDGTAANWNGLANPGASIASGMVVNQDGDFLTGVSFATNSPNPSGSNAASGPSSTYPFIPNEAQGDWWFEGEQATDFVFTFSGLDDTLTYDLILGAYRLDLDATATENASSGWEVNGIQMATDPNSFSDSYVIFNGLMTDGSGNLVIASTELNGNPTNAVSALSLGVSPAGFAPVIAVDLALCIEDDPNTPGNLLLTWDSESGSVYNILSNTDLDTPTSTWSVLPGGGDIAADASGTNTLSISQPSDPKTFFVLSQQ